jgi:uncharacterized protein YmfQ (DUF2313 family)
MDKFTQALSSLLPKGYAWPRQPNTVLMRTLEGIAGGHRELYEFTWATVQQWLPDMTSTRLAEWEEAAGLPDMCLGFDQTVQQRQSALVRRLRGVSLPYADSSPAAPGAIEAALAGLGYTAEVRYNFPFRVGVRRVGNRLGALDGRLWLFLTATASASDHTVVSCYLKRIVPARFEINLIFE